MNKNLISFDSTHLSFKLNKKFTIIMILFFESFLLLNSKHKIFGLLKKMIDTILKKKATRLKVQFQNLFKA